MDKEHKIIFIITMFIVILLFIILYFKFRYDQQFAELKCKEYTYFPNKNLLQKITVTENAVLSGQPVKLGELPHMALIQSFGQSGTLCGGTLISKYFVLTAGHCGNVVSKNGARILLGLTEWDYDGEHFNDEAVYFYGNTKKYEPPHDIALIRLNRAVEFTSIIRPICLNTKLDVRLETLISAGWGKYEGHKYSKTLRWVYLNPMPNSECLSTFPTKFTEAYYICAGHATQYKDACEGDSGGPLQMFTENEKFYGHLQVGIVAFGKPCNFTGHHKIVGGYAKVAYYITWIESIVWS